MSFKNAQKKAETMDALSQLRDALNLLGPIPTDMNIYDYAVHFFNIIASFNDKYAVSEDMFKGNPEDAKVLALHLERAGRDNFGWVRSKKGQEVTLDNLYLGNVLGIFTRTAREFKNLQNDPFTQKAIQSQVHNFIKSHREPMIGLINKVLKTERKPSGLFLGLFGNKKNKSK